MIITQRGYRFGLHELKVITSVVFDEAQQVSLVQSIFMGKSNPESPFHGRPRKNFLHSGFEFEKTELLRLRMSQTG